MDQLPTEQLKILLPTLRESLDQLHNALDPHYPTRLLHLHSPFQPQLTSILLRAFLKPHQHVFVDCVALHSPKLIYDVVLNGLAQWSPVFSSEFHGALNWNGQLEYHTHLDYLNQQRRVWDTEMLPEVTGAKGALAGHYNESLASFLEGLQKLFELDTRPKVIIFESAHRLLPMAHTSATTSNALEPGVHDGAFLAAMTRLGEFVRAMYGPAQIVLAEL